MKGTLVAVATKAKMVADCPCCKGFGSETPVTLYREGGDVAGLTHAIPSIWLLGRSGRIEREDALSPVDAHFAACRQFAWHCGIENSRNN